MLKGNVIALNPREDARWDQYVRSHEMASVYHHSKWLETLHQTYGYQPIHLAYEDEEKKIQGVLPLFLVISFLTGKRMISAPFSPFCGPLVDKKELLDDLLANAESCAQSVGADHIQLRMDFQNLEIQRQNYSADHFYKIHVLDLQQDMDSLISHYHPSCIRRPYLQSLKSGLELQVASSEQDVRSFYHLQIMTRKRQGVIPQPIDYFLNMWNQMHPVHMMKVLMAVYDRQVVASIILLMYNNKVIYQNGASDNKYLHLKPNHFLLGKAIEMSKTDGYSQFNFGTSTPNNEGLIQFKRRWGTQEFDLCYYYYPMVMGARTHIETSFAYKMASSVFRHLPHCFLKNLGKVCYKHFA